VLDRLRVGALADAGQRHLALVAVERGGADFDEFVRAQGAVDFGDDGVGEALFTQLQDGVEVVGAGFEGFALCGGEIGFHGRAILAPLLAHGLEERVAEDAVCLSRPVQIPDACIEGFRLGDAGLKRGFPDTLDHRGERLLREAVDKMGFARIHVHHPWRDANRVETSPDHQWVELPSDQRVAASHLLQLD